MEGELLCISASLLRQMLKNRVTWGYFLPSVEMTQLSQFSNLRFPMHLWKRFWSETAALAEMSDGKLRGLLSRETVPVSSGDKIMVSVDWKWPRGLSLNRDYWNSSGRCTKYQNLWKIRPSIGQSSMCFIFPFTGILFWQAARLHVLQFKYLL